MHFAHAALTEEENEHHRRVKDETFDCRGVADYVIMSTRKRFTAIQANFLSIQTSERLAAAALNIEVELKILLKCCQRSDRTRHSSPHSENLWEASLTTADLFPSDER